MSLAEALRDTDRVEYFEGYANAMLQAVTEDGVPVKDTLAGVSTKSVGIFYYGVPHGSFVS